MSSVVPRRDPSYARQVAFVALILAFAVRLYWVFRVQSPFDAVWSDMQGYVTRAKEFAAGTQSGFPRSDAFYPFGTHYFYGFLFAKLGYKSQTAIKVIQALLTALPVYFFARLIWRMVQPRALYTVVVLIAAVWQPAIWFTGYFLSEVPFVALLYLNMWLCVRFYETKRGGYWVGFTGALLFVVRPQVILTLALLGAIVVLRRGVRRTFSGLSFAVIGFAPILIYSMVRFHALTGRVGLISENANLNRVFADTPIAIVETHITLKNGQVWAYGFSPPTKGFMGEREAVRLEGYIGDPDLMNRVRRDRLRGLSIWWRIHRAFNNVRLLWDRNEPWPESEGARHDGGFRRFLHLNCSAIARWLFVPLVPVGLIFLRKSATYVVAYAHLITLVVLSMLYYPESRYRCPYDFLLLAITAALLNRAWRVARARWRRTRVARGAATV